MKNFYFLYVHENEKNYETAQKKKLLKMMIYIGFPIIWILKT
jgi:hypothetical protein